MQSEVASREYATPLAVFEGLVDRAPLPRDSETDTDPDGYSSVRKFAILISLRRHLPQFLLPCPVAWNRRFRRMVLPRAVGDLRRKRIPL